MDPKNARNVPCGSNGLAAGSLPIPKLIEMKKSRARFCRRFLLSSNKVAKSIYASLCWEDENLFYGIGG